MNSSNASGCTCIVPFYNEGERVIDVVSFLVSLPSINHVICVDDGSHTSQMADALREKFKQIEVIRLEKNLGKSGAVEKGLDHVKTDYVLLIDADLKNLSAREVTFAITSIEEDPSVDMLVFKRTAEPFYIRVFRWDTLISGERILRTTDLKGVFSLHPKGYQLEYAVNKYMMNNKKRVYWVPSRGANVYKIHKEGFIKGFIRDVKIHLNFTQYVGLLFIMKCYILFCRREYHKPARV